MWGPHVVPVLIAAAMLTLAALDPAPAQMQPSPRVGPVSMLEQEVAKAKCAAVEAEAHYYQLDGLAAKQKLEALQRQIADLQAQLEQLKASNKTGVPPT